MHVVIVATRQDSAVDAANNNLLLRQQDGLVQLAGTQVTLLVSVADVVNRKPRQVGHVPADMQVIQQDSVADAVNRKHNNIKLGRVNKMLGRRGGGGNSLVRGIKKGAGIGIGMNIANSLANRNQNQQNINQQQQGWRCGCGQGGNTGRFCSACGTQQGGAPQQAPAPQQNAAPAAAATGGFLDRLAGSAEKMMDATTDHIKSANIGECEYCGSKISQGDKTCSSCGGTF